MKLYFEASVKKIDTASENVIKRVVNDSMYTVMGGNNYLDTYKSSVSNPTARGWINYLLHESDFKDNVLKALDSATTLGSFTWTGPGASTKKPIGGGTPYSDKVKEEMKDYFLSLSDGTINRKLLLTSMFERD